MKRSNFWVCLVALLVISMQSFAQDRDRNNGRNGRDPSRREEIMAKRNTYLTEKMGLTAAEAAVFIPLDNELLQKKFEVSRDCRRLDRELHNKKDKTDEDFKKILKCREEVKEMSDRLDKEYNEKFKKVLPAEKILKYKHADQAFFDENFRDRR